MPISATATKKSAAPLRAEAAEASPIELNEAAVARALKVVEQNPALGKVYDRLRELVAQATVEEAKARYAMGHLVGKVRDEKERYGKRSVEALATLLRFDASTLYDYASVAETWDPKEFSSLLKRKTAAGLGLRFSHLVVVACVKDDRRRSELISRTLEQSLTVRQLANLVRHDAEGGDGPSEESPRPADVVRRVAARWEAAGAELDRDTHELEQLTSKAPEVLALLQKTADHQRALADKAIACADKLDALAKAGFQP